MRRGRSSSRGVTVLLAIVVTLLGGAVLASAGWGPVFLAVGVALVLAFVTGGRRRSRRRKFRR